jgi:hypothetical protein
VLVLDVRNAVAMDARKLSGNDVRRDRFGLRRFVKMLQRRPVAGKGAGAKVGGGAGGGRAKKSFVHAQAHTQAQEEAARKDGVPGKLVKGVVAAPAGPTRPDGGVDGDGGGGMGFREDGDAGRTFVVGKEGGGGVEEEWEELEGDGPMSDTAAFGNRAAPPPGVGVRVGGRASLDGRAINDPYRYDGVGNDPDSSQQVLGTRRFRSVGGLFTTNRRMSRSSMCGDVCPPRPSSDRRNPLSLTDGEVNKITRQPSNGFVFGRAAF